MPSIDEDEGTHRIALAQHKEFDEAGLARHGAYGSAIGRRIRQKRSGRRLQQLCLRVFVDEKTDDQKALGDRFLPRCLSVELPEGTVQVPIDICRFERPRLQYVDFGAQLAVNKGTPDDPDPSGGTLGGWAWDCQDESLVMLTNEHVLGSLATPRTITQYTGPIGRTKRAVNRGDADAAIADPLSEEDFEPSIGELGPAIFATTQVQQGWRVEKLGAETRHRWGIVEASHYELHAPENGIVMTDGFAVRPLKKKWTKDGDSGGLVFRCRSDRKEYVKEVVGLHFAKHGNLGLASHIEDVFGALTLASLAENPFVRFLDSLFHAAAGDPPFEFLALRRASRQSREDPSRGRELFERMRGLDDAAVLVGLFRAHRVGLLKALVTDVPLRWQLASALHPFLGGAASVDEVLARPVTLQSAKQLRDLIARLGADDRLKHSLRPIARALDEAVGVPFGEVLNHLPRVKRPSRKKLK